MEIENKKVIMSHRRISSQTFLAKLHAGVKYQNVYRLPSLLIFLIPFILVHRVRIELNF